YRVGGVEFDGVLYEVLVDRGGRRPIPTVAELVRRIADDDVELHVSSEDLCNPCGDVVGVCEGIGVRLEGLTAVVIHFAGTAEPAPPVLIDHAVLTGHGVDLKLALASGPRVLSALEPDVPVFRVE